MSTPDATARPTDPATDPTTPQIVELDGARTIVVRGVVPSAELPGFFDRSFGALGAGLARQPVAVTGPAFGLYRSFDDGIADLEVGFPIDGEAASDGEIVASTLPGGRVARLLHHGSFDQLGTSWERLRAWIVEQGETPRPEFWEVYVTEPSPDMDPADLVTELYWPLAG